MKLPAVRPSIGRRFLPGPWARTRPLLRFVGSNPLVDPTKLSRWEVSVQMVIRIYKHKISLHKMCRRPNSTPQTPYLDFEWGTRNGSGRENRKWGKRREKWDPTKFEEKSTRMIRPWNRTTVARKVSFIYKYINIVAACKTKHRNDSCVVYRPTQRNTYNSIGI